MVDDWQARVDAVWSDESLSEGEVVAAIDALAAECPEDAPVALVERAGARDSAGLEAQAEPLYRRALAGGLDDDRRTRATIQLASTIRNLGKIDEALTLLEAEYRTAAGPMRDAAAAFYALALASAGNGPLAASVALETLAPHLPLYTRSVTGYARELRDADA